MNSLLSDISSDKTVKILKVNSSGKLLHKLLDMGFVVGSIIEVVREAPFYDPMELKIHNYHISLRKSEASLIEVEPV